MVPLIYSENNSKMSIVLVWVDLGKDLLVLKHVL